MVTSLAPPVLLGDDLDVESDQRADVRRGEAVGAEDVDHAPARRQRHADLDDTRIASAGSGIDPLTQRDFVCEWNKAQRILGPVHRLIGARGRSGWLGRARIEQLERRGSAVDRGFADVVGVSEGGGLARDAAKAEA